MILKFIYTLFLSLLLALFVGLGIDAFYPGPNSPEYPSELNATRPDCVESEDQKNTRIRYDEILKKYEKKSQTYNRDVSIISIISAILLLVASFTFLKKIKMIADGILLGGVFVTLYSIIRGLMSQDSRFRFAVVAFGLIIALALGYIKFIRSKNEKDGE